MNKIRALAAACFALLSSRCLALDSSTYMTPTLQAAAYAASNSLGGWQNVPFFKTNQQPYSGLLDAIYVSWKGGSTVSITFYIFDTLPTATTCTDKTAFSLGAADIPKLAVAPFTLTPAATQGTTTTSAQLVQATSMRNNDTTRNEKLYVCLVAGAAVTPPSTSELTFKFSGVLD